MYKFKIKIPKELDIYIKSQIESQLDKGLNDVADWIGTESDRILRQEYPDGAFDTGFLANSIVIDKEDFLKKEVGSNCAYAPFIEYGTNPHFPPLDAIYSWIFRKRKDLHIKYNKNKTTILNGKTYNADILKIAWAISINISKHGTEEKPYLRPSFYSGINKLKEFLSKEFKQ